MANKLLLKKSSVAARVPTTSDLTYGELALNYQDGKLYFKTAGNSIDYFLSGSAAPSLQAVTNTAASSSNQITLSGAGDNTNTYSSLRFAGYNQGGGTGYHGFFEVQNTYASATNPKKFFRLDSSGTLQIINSAYTNNLFNLTDAGALSIPSTLTVGGGGVIYNGSTSGNITLKATAAAGSNTITLPAATGTVALTTDIIAQKKQEYTATAGQTTFTVTNGYTVGAVQVFANGIALASSDYTASNGTTVILNDARLVGDNIIIWGGGAVQGSGGGGGTTTNALTIGTGLQLDSGTTFDGSAAKTLSLTTSGVTANTYGNSYVSGAYFYLPQFTVDAYGRITAVSQAYVAISGGTTLPGQYGNSGKFLTTDGTNLSWGTPVTSGGSGSNLAWTNGAYAASTINLTAPAGVTTSGQQLWVAVIGSNLSSANISSVTCNGYSLSLSSSGGPDSGGTGMVLYKVNTGSQFTTSVSVNFSGYAGYAMATCWVTTTNSTNMGSGFVSTTSSSSSMIPNNPSYTKGGKVFFFSTTSSLNMTTAISSPPSGWTSIGTNTHSSSSSITVAAFSAPEPWSSSATFTVTNPGAYIYGYAYATNS